MCIILLFTFHYTGAGLIAGITILGVVIALSVGGAVFFFIGKMPLLI
jgi:hypothetical protein